MRAISFIAARQRGQAMRDFVPNSIRVPFDWNTPDPARSLNFLPVTNVLETDSNRAVYVLASFQHPLKSRRDHAIAFARRFLEFIWFDDVHAPPSIAINPASWKL
jgi:hypothetical protein